ncbi:MAG: TetR/AcrR family transcriptional regulator C-terminal domain-containing protein [Clostridia bacterium]|nr:TetR/AcrR family transcriptional regulator C-terminal domain-containing protein [Clostridia bacterium]
MNTPNNKRRKQSLDKIHRVFIELLQTNALDKITVSQICKNTGLNRSTFYANFLDIYDLADKTRHILENEFSNLFADYDYFNEQTGAEKMFEHIKENQIFYKTYFKLCYDSSHLISMYDPRRAELELDSKDIKYHIEFFRNGLNAIIKLWLENGCQESPTQMAEILKMEYKGR